MGIRAIRFTFFTILVLILPISSIFPELYDFKLTYHPTRSMIKGTVRIAFTRQEIGVSAHLLLFNNLLSTKDPQMNCLREDATYRHGFQPGYTKITGIVDDSGAAVPITATSDPPFLENQNANGKEAVSIELPDKDSYVLNVDFETVLPAMLSENMTSLNNIWLQQFLWYPKLFSQDNEFLIKPVKYSLTLSLPEGYQLITGFKDLYAEGVWHMESGDKVKHSIPICIIPEKKYSRIDLNTRNYDIEIYTQPENTSQARKILTFAADALDYYVTKYGKLEFERIVIFESPLQSFSSSAISGFIVLGGANFDAEMFNPGQLDPYVDYNLSSEIARMYFRGENNIVESLIRYVNIQYIEEKYGPDHSISMKGSGLIDISTPHANLREEVYHGFIALKDSDLKLPAFALSNELYRNDRAQGVYYRGILALRQIATEMGRSTFNRAIDSLYERHSYIDAAKFLQVIEEYHPGITSKAVEILYSPAYPDFSFQEIIRNQGSTTLCIQETNHTGYSTVLQVKTDKGVKVFTVKDGDAVTVGGKLLSASIDPDWYTLDINRKNNYFPRKFNFFLSRHSKFEADSLEPALGMAGEAGEKEYSDGIRELDLLAGIQYKSEGLISLYIEGGGIVDTILPYQSFTIPQFQFSGLFAGVALEFSRSIKIGAEYRYFLDGRWQAELSLKRENEFTKEALYYPQVFYSLGLALNEKKEISTSLELLFTELPFLLPFLVPVSVNTSFDPYTLDIQGTASVSLFSYFRLLPRVYLSPSIDGAIGFGTDEIPNVPGRARVTKGYMGKHRLSAGLDLLFPIVTNLDTKIINMVLLQGILSSVYSEIEQLHSISSPGIQSLHMGLEIGFNFSTISSTLSGDTLSPIAIGLDIPIRDIARIDAYRFFIYTSLPLKYYGMILN